MYLSYSRAEFTIDLLAEYEWPHNEPASHRETFMIQEQIAEYLGVKSFKRKYPDLVRRPVDMEERNYIFENGLATEKLCDLGLTAVFASEVGSVHEMKSKSLQSFSFRFLTSCATIILRSMKSTNDISGRKPLGLHECASKQQSSTVVKCKRTKQFPQRPIGTQSSTKTAEKIVRAAWTFKTF